MNVSPEVLDWVRKADRDLAAAQRLTGADPPLPDIFRYPEEWSDEASALRSIEQAERVRALVHQKLGYASDSNEAP